MLKSTVTLLILLSSSVLFANQTATKAVFGGEATIGQDLYGNTLYDRDVAIQTTDFTVQNFWKKFSWSGTGENSKTFALVDTNGTIRAKVQSSFACQDGGLDIHGCSGQKPFLLNAGTLNNAGLQTDADGQPLAANQYRIPFDDAANYGAGKTEAFYALDVFRDGKYYSDGTSAQPKTFFGFLYNLLDLFFAKPVADSISSADSPELRNRYMANITYGLQEDYMLAKDVSAIHTNETNTADSSKRVSLLKYSVEDIESKSGCTALFLTFNSSTLTCKAVNFLGLTMFSPIINSTTQKVEMQTDLVAEDTETTLLALAGKLDGKNYVTEKTQIDSTTGKTTLMTSLFKPMTSLISSFMSILFGQPTVPATPEVVSSEFTFDNPMPLTFIETDGIKATGFDHFLLMGLESVYGNQRTCTVQTTSGFWPFITTSTTTYIEGDGQINSETMLTWCQGQQSTQSSFFSFFVGLVSGSSSTSTITNWFSSMLSWFSWGSSTQTVNSYTEQVNKRLILRLEKIDGFEPELKGTTSTYEIINIQRGH